MSSARVYKWCAKYAGMGASLISEALKLPRKTFYDKLARHGLKPEGFRKGG